MDLTVPQYLDRTFDWVMSMEVGEHIPAEFEQILLDNIARHAREGVLLTWAVPGQGGHHHVNMHTNDYIIKKLADRGFAYDGQESTGLRSVAGLPWFTNTIMVFRRQ
jgi:hypothetical protein